MEITLTALHWIYLIGTIFVIAAMCMKRDVVLPCMIFTILSGFVASGSIADALLTEARALMFAWGEFGSLIVGIGIMTMMSKQMADMGTDRTLIEPLAKIVRSPMIAYLVLGIVMAIITALVWPSPGIALVGALLTPIAIKAGLPAIWAAVAMNMFGHGATMSLDPVIQGAVGITAGTAGIDIGAYMSRSWPVWLASVIVALVCSFIACKIDLVRNREKHEADSAIRMSSASEMKEFHPGAKFMAAFTVVAFVLAVGMILTQGLTGNDALYVLIGVGCVLSFVGAVIQHGVDSLGKFVDYAREGMQFGMMAFTPVLFIGGFFFIGGSGISSILTGEYAQGVLMDWAWWVADKVPLSPIPIVILLMIIGGITGLDGSGFSGLPLCGSLALAFGTACDMDIMVLAMVGQLGAVWIGGGTVVPWSVIPVAAMCNVDARELCAKNMVPTFLGLAAACVVAIIMLL